MTFWPHDWAAILVPDAPIAELVVRGTLIYGFLYILMRTAGRRLVARLAVSDMVVMLLLAVAVRDGITGAYSTVGDAAISAVTILGWDLIIDRLAYRFAWLRRPLRHNPLLIVEDGRLLSDNARDQLLTRADIMARVRAEGLTSLEQVREAYLERDGTLSVVPK